MLDCNIKDNKTLNSHCQGFHVNMLVPNHCSVNWVKFEYRCDTHFLIQILSG